jgi:hypothetical protein
LEDILIEILFVRTLYTEINQAFKDALNKKTQTESKSEKTQAIIPLNFLSGTTG